MKLITIEKMKIAAPSTIHLALDSGIPYLYCDGTCSNGVAAELPRVPAAFEVSLSDAICSINRKVITVPSGEFGYTNNYTYLEFQDMVTAFGYDVDNITSDQVRILFYFMPIFKYAFHFWSEILIKLLSDTGSVRMYGPVSIQHMVHLGLVSVGVIGNGKHIMLSATGARLASAISILLHGLLEGVAPSNYVTDDLKNIAYMRLWEERQGKMKPTGMARRKNLDDMVMEIL